jgi:hypothetical protein
VNVSALKNRVQTKIVTADPPAGFGAISKPENVSLIVGTG